RDEETNVRKLMSGRIDAWLGGRNGALEAAAHVGIPRGDLREGLVLENYVVWLAASLETPPAEASRWRDAFEAVRVDGTLARILHKHSYLPSSK
ncbi:transporter substrate-binding domain-containing protein, partial [Massilia mucilaginosa]